MDAIIAKARKGTDGCQDALTSLNLLNFMCPQPSETLPISLDRVRLHYATACKVRTVAMCLGRTTLDDACKVVMELTDYVARTKYKKKLHCDLTVPAVLQTMGTMIMCYKNWTTTLLDVTATAVLQRLEDAIQAAIKGDEFCLQFLGVEGLKALPINRVKHCPSLSHLKVKYTTAMQLGAVGIFMQDKIMECINGDTMSYAKWMASEAFPGKNLEMEFDGSDVCESLVVEIGQVKNMLQKAEVPLRRWSMHQHGMMADEIEDEIEEEYNDPSYRPIDDSPDSSQSDSEEEDPLKQRAKKRKEKTKQPFKVLFHKSPQKNTVGSDADKQVQGLGVRVRPSQEVEEEENQAKKSIGSGADKQVQLEPSQHNSRKRPSQEVEEEEKQTKKSKLSPSSKQPSSTSVTTERQRSHHAKRSCLVCNKMYSNLKRHLASHVKKGHIEQCEVEKLLNMAAVRNRRHGPRRVGKDGPRRGLKFKWCSFENCCTVTCYLRSHLLNFHKMKPGELLEKHVKVAKDYKG